MEDPLMEVRASLTSTVNATGGLGSSTYGGVEIQKMTDTLISDSINRGVDLKPLITRKNMKQLAYFWNIRANLGSTSKATFYDDGSYGTPHESTKYGFLAVAKSLRSDYGVTGLMIAASSSYYDALADEAKCAIDELKLAEERTMICGTTTADTANENGYALSDGYLGLLQLMRWYDTNGGTADATSAHQMKDTTAVYGLTRDGSAQGDTIDVSFVLAGTVGAGGSTGTLELKHLDKAITRSNKKGGKDHERIFFCSEERVDEINQLLQPQQRFAGTLNLEGGFTLSTYKTIPIVGSRYMDQNGATNTGSWDVDTDADNSMYLLDLDEIEFRVVDGVDATHVVVQGGIDTGNIRLDEQGGYFKTYGVLVMRSFWPQVHIANLTAPA